MKGSVAAMMLGMVLALGCDTTRNTPYPADNFFIRYYGTDGDQRSVDMVANEDGTFTLLGTSVINEESQIYLLKVNGHGIVLWEQYYRWDDNLIAIDIEPTGSDGFVILGEVEKPSRGKDIFLMTVDGAGTKIDTSSFWYPGGSDEIGSSVTPITNGSSLTGFIVAGHTNSPSMLKLNEDPNTTALFVRFEPNGSLYQGAWTEHGGGARDDFGTKVFQVGPLQSPLPFLFFGYTNSDQTDAVPSFDFWASPLNAFGGELLLIEGVLPPSPPNTNEILSFATQTLVPSNYLLTGLLDNGSGDAKIIMAGVSKGLNIGLPQKSLDGISLGGVGSLTSEYQRVVAFPSRDFGYLIMASSYRANQGDIVLTKVDVQGEPVWDSPVILGGQEDDFGSAVYELADGRILVFGTLTLGDGRGQLKMALMMLNQRGEFRK
jgi:hypothetical protein